MTISNSAPDVFTDMPELRDPLFGLPVELSCQILGYVPTFQRLVLQRVSQSWRHILSLPSSWETLDLDYDYRGKRSPPEAYMQTKEIIKIIDKAQGGLLHLSINHPMYSTIVAIISHIATNKVSESTVSLRTLKIGSLSNYLDFRYEKAIKDRNFRSVILNMRKLQSLQIVNAEVLLNSPGTSYARTSYLLSESLTDLKITNGFYSSGYGVWRWTVEAPRLRRLELSAPVDCRNDKPSISLLDISHKHAETLVSLKITRLHMGRTSDEEPMFHRLEELDLQSVQLETLRFLPVTMRTLRLDGIGGILQEILEGWAALDRPNMEQHPSIKQGIEKEADQRSEL